jgi:hypothetical protein
VTLRSNPLYFTIGGIDGKDLSYGIPVNYFCSWTVELDPKKAYVITVNRGTQILEDLNFYIVGQGKQELVTNQDLLANTLTT